LKMLRVRVSQIKAEAESIRSLRLAPVEGGLPTFTPGAHIRVRTDDPDGVHTARSYSLVNDPGVRDYYEIGVLRLGRGGTSDWLHGVEVGRELAIEPPRNSFPLATHASEHLLIGGGIGVTPLLAMAAQLARQRARFVLWALVRSRDRLPFADRLAALPPRVAHVHVSTEAGRCDLRSLLDAAPPERHVYVCGPRGLTEAVRTAAHDIGMPAARVHAESFDGGTDPRADRAFDVELRGSRLRFRVEPGQTILELAEAAGIFVGHDCRRGECGACLTRVVEGVPEHRDTVQTLAEKATNEFMTICCSRAATGRIVLDL
jgi:vanillate O-demethylase ferredoxin subunit